MNMAARKFNRDRLPDPEGYYKAELGSLRRGSNGWHQTKCPFHDERNPSFSVNIRTGGFKCFGCGECGGDIVAFQMKRYSQDFKSACQSLNAWDDTAPQAQKPRLVAVEPKATPKAKAKPEKQGGSAMRRIPAKFKQGCFDSWLWGSMLEMMRDACGKDLRIERVYPYADIVGDIVDWQVVCREANGKKHCRPFKIDGNYLRFGKATTKGRPLYPVSMLLHPENAGKPVFVVEGEKCCEALLALGFLAVTSGSATSAGSSDWEPLAGREVWLWGDNDKPGNAYLRDVCEILDGLVASTTIINSRALGLDEGGDVADLVAQAMSYGGDM